MLTERKGGCVQHNTTRKRHVEIAGKYTEKKQDQHTVDGVEGGSVHHVAFRKTLQNGVALNVDGVGANCGDHV